MSTKDTNHVVDTHQITEDLDQHNNHNPPSPASSAEKFFLKELNTSNISAFALSASIRQIHPQSSKSDLSSSVPNSVATDDYATACEEGFSEDDEEYFVSSRSEEEVIKNTNFIVSRHTPIEEEASNSCESEHEEKVVPPEETEIGKTDRMMESEKSSQRSEQAMKEQTIAPTAPTTAPTTVPSESTTAVSFSESKEEEPLTTEPNTPVTNEEEDYNVTQLIYTEAKTIWGLGKTYAILKPFLGLTENVASRVVTIGTGMELSDVDKTYVVPNLEKLDVVYVNPSIGKAVGYIQPAMEKGDKVVRPVFQKAVVPVLKPLGLVEKGENLLDFVFMKKDVLEENVGGSEEEKVDTPSPVVVVGTKN